ncbi:MAG: peptide chain release factor N(5)-glutamine methyltransferase, partial [Hyphomicrobiales bacterium]|nr:peptide chain release factor N(5)-glutamine methyltransferase [Hyphomicrobiales bacterium]
KEAKLHIADIGTGSGAVIIALLSELPNATGVAVDISPSALVVAQTNAQKHRLEQRISFLPGSYCHPLTREGVAGKFDVIVSNPPYIRSAEIGELMPEVEKHDPLTALDGGVDGLDAYRQLLGGSANHLHASGSVFFEIGHDQADDVRKIATVHGWQNAKIMRDLQGNDRVFYAEH